MMKSSLWFIMKIMRSKKHNILPKVYRKTLLYKSKVEYANFCLNHVEGCSHGCRYPCYAMMMKKRCGLIKDYQEWIKPKLVGNALELLDKEIPKYKSKIKLMTSGCLYMNGSVEKQRCANLILLLYLGSSLSSISKAVPTNLGLIHS